MKFTFFEKTQMDYTNFLIFATHAVLTTFNKGTIFQNDLINIIGEVAS